MRGPHPTYISISDFFVFPPLQIKSDGQVQKKTSTKSAPWYTSRSRAMKNQGLFCVFRTSVNQPSGATKIQLELRTQCCLVPQIPCPILEPLRALSSRCKSFESSNLGSTMYTQHFCECPNSHCCSFFDPLK